MRRALETILVPLFVACIALGALGRAHAQDRARALASPVGHARVDRSQFALDASVMTMLPLVIGGTIGFEVPGHVVFRVGVGIVPSAYVDAIRNVGAVWGLDPDSGRTMSLLLNDATFFEVGLAVRPMGTPGIELALSYALLWTHRRIDMAQLGGAGHDAGLDLTIDAVHAELAWQTEPADHVFLRIALGWAHAFDHRVSIAGEGDAQQRAAFHATADAIADAIGRHAFGPTLGASLGVRF